MRQTCVVPIVPVAKGRPRVTRNGTYTPAATRQAEKDIRTYWSRTNRHGFPDDAALRVTVEAVLARPKTAPRKRRHPVVKPDWDNYAKLVCDALNGLAWHDDGQVVDGRCIKRYAAAGEPPHLVITVEDVDVPEPAPTPTPADELAAALARGGRMVRVSRTERR